MEYNKLVSVTGLPGLYELISSKGDGAVIRSLDDGSTKFAATRSHNFSHLESIEIYTQRENVNLVDIFNAIEKAGESLPDTKDTNAIKKYFEKVYPELDFERVYMSDMKKMIKWYEQLKKHNIEIKLTEIEEEPVEEVKEEDKKPEPAKATKKSKEKKETTASTEAEEPKKKAASTKKKKTE